MTLPIGTASGDRLGTDRAAAVTHFGKRVRVIGTAAAIAIATTEGAATEGAERLAVRSIERLDPVSEATDAPAATVTGRVLFILLKFKGDTHTPHPPSFFEFLTNPTTPPPPSAYRRRSTASSPRPRGTGSSGGPTSPASAA